MIKRLRFFFLLLIVVGASAAGGTLFARFLAPPQNPYIVGDYTEQRLSAGADVVLMGTEWCPYCAQTREHLQQRGVQFVELDVDTSEQAESWLQQLDAPGVPVLLVGDRQIRGFRPKVIDEALQVLRSSPRP